MTGQKTDNSNGILPKKEEASDKIKYPPVKVFIPGTGDRSAVDINDIKQRDLENCNMLALMASIAHCRPEKISEIIKEQRAPNGAIKAYVVTLQDYGAKTNYYWREKKIIVPANIITQGLRSDFGDIDSKGFKEIWPIVLEKALFKFNGLPFVIKDNKSTLNRNYSDVYETIFAKFSGTFIFPRESNAIDFKTLKGEFDQKKPMIVDTLGLSEAAARKYDLETVHSYAVKNIYTDPKGNGWIVLYNPWGSNHPKPIPFQYLISKNFTLDIMDGRHLEK